jgi:DNA-binding NarL/FixJ family response regulator
VVTARAMCDDSNVHTTVLIVDDHEGFRSSARRLLELDGFDVVGEAADGASALELVHELEPELVLLDVALPDTSGFEVAEQLAGVPAKVILISSRELQDFGERVRRSGALGFVSKDRLSGAALQALLGGRS